MEAASAQIALFYDDNSAMEHNRLIENPIEYAVTWAAIQRMISGLVDASRQRLRILDIGGGTGRYAVRLAKLGHEVHLCDISAQELEIATQHARDQQVELANATQLDARNIRNMPDLFKPGHYDMILCMGPFYHLLEKADREQLLQSLCDMTRPEGYIAAAFVTTYAHLRDVARKDPRRLLHEKDFYGNYFRTGQYTRTLPMHHTCSVEIKELTSKYKDSVRLERLLACESFLTGSLGTSLTALSTEEFEPWAEIAIRCAEYPDHVGAADHILAVLQKK